MKTKRGTAKAEGRTSAIDLAIFYGLVSAIAALGGSSRYDLMQVAILQPLLWLGLGLGLFRMKGLSVFAGVFWLVLGYGAWLALQLVPLPFGVWSQLPGREAIVAADTVIGYDLARPFSLAPARTLHALAYFPIFLAPLVAAINLGPDRARHIAWSILAMALVSGVFGLLQVLSGEFFFYSITSSGRMVGLFANANHAAVFGSFAVALAAACLAVSHNRWTRQACFASAGALFLLMIGNGSRGGLLTLAIATLVFFLVYALTQAGNSKPSRLSLRIPLPVAGLALLILTVGAAFLLTGNIYALEQLTQDDALGDTRFVINPVAFEMAKTFFPLGSGIGSFEDVFYIFEPDVLLSPNYVNMAHNDLLQVVIEGGLPALGFLAAAFWMAVRNLRRYGATLQEDQRRALWLAAMSMLAVLVLASAFDYPLRAPIFQAVLVLSLAMLVDRARFGDLEAPAKGRRTHPDP